MREQAAVTAERSAPCMEVPPGMPEQIGNMPVGIVLPAKDLPGTREPAGDMTPESAPPAAVPLREREAAPAAVPMPETAGDGSPE